ncbi:AMP-binding protein, partial [Klebsiella quasipneumoniae]|uniref:AMP-binding protein n=1 Tax=Klebsiella quasipneumoniae TaxID=1463165 RepID=UPI0034E0515A
LAAAVGFDQTSGTTGLPKAGIMKHGRWTKTAVSFGSIALDMGPEDVLYCTLPLYHATGLCGSCAYTPATRQARFP